MGRGLIILLALMVLYALVRAAMAHYRKEALRTAREERLAREKERAMDVADQQRTTKNEKPQMIVEARYRDLDPTEQTGKRHGEDGATE